MAKYPPLLTTESADYDSCALEVGSLVTSLESSNQPAKTSFVKFKIFAIGTLLIAACGCYIAATNSGGDENSFDLAAQHASKGSNEHGGTMLADESLCDFSKETKWISNHSSQNSSYGYQLIVLERRHWTDLVDTHGQVKHRWFHSMASSKGAHLLPNGHLARSAYYAEEGDDPSKTYDDAGLVEEVDWDGNVVRSCIYRSDKHVTTHDMMMMPNGNFLCNAMVELDWDVCHDLGMDLQHGIGRQLYFKSLNVQKKASERHRLTPKLLCETDGVVELKIVPNQTECEVVWEWWASDHIIQDLRPKAKNYGSIDDNPQLIDVNYGMDMYMNNGGSPELLHLNSVDYNEELDQVMFNAMNKGETYIVDHSTTKKEAASHSGGKHGIGGDILYRWGNAQVYNTKLRIVDPELYPQKLPAECSMDEMPDTEFTKGLCVEAYYSARTKENCGGSVHASGFQYFQFTKPGSLDSFDVELDELVNYGPTPNGGLNCLFLSTNCLHGTVKTQNGESKKRGFEQVSEVSCSGKKNTSVIYHPANHRPGQWNFHAHNAKWIPQGLPGAGNVTMFANRHHMYGPTWAKLFDRIAFPPQPIITYPGAVQFAPSLTAFGNYTLDPYWEQDPNWQCYIDAWPSCARFGGVQRLSNGNTVMVCGFNAAPMQGDMSDPKSEFVFKNNPEISKFVEVDVNCNTVWELNITFPQHVDGAEEGSVFESDDAKMWNRMIATPFTWNGLFHSDRIFPDHPGLKGKKLYNSTSECAVHTKKHLEVMTKWAIVS
ncbi:hypothetical protein CYMTET_7583 [Cymbomonas tetramitiformis]|uniref:Uncharacterized protein n=1 Tax=Cymbomonas tetramitiformis TaxID=36881 RepID=A0AAE0GUR1_9CHLO|nr:hypothetical protein CYMTET_7583 [Cymbomonas tetramitiformis]